jgi:hypothetical protein
MFTGLALHYSNASGKTVQPAMEDLKSPIPKK